MHRPQQSSRKKKRTKKRERSEVESYRFHGQNRLYTVCASTWAPEFNMFPLGLRSIFQVPRSPWEWFDCH